MPEVNLKDDIRLGIQELIPSLKNKSTNMPGINSSTARTGLIKSAQILHRHDLPLLPITDTNIKILLSMTSKGGVIKLLVKLPILMIMNLRIFWKQYRCIHSSPYLLQLRLHLFNKTMKHFINYTYHKRHPEKKWQTNWNKIMPLKRKLVRQNIHHIFDINGKREKSHLSKHGLWLQTPWLQKI